MSEYSKMAKGSYTVSGGTLGVSGPNAKMINLPFRPDFVELINYTQMVTPAQHGIVRAYWDSGVTPITVSSVQYDTMVDIFNATPALITDSVQVGGGISVFTGAQALQFGPTLSIASITKASPAVVTTTTNHNLTSGDVVIMSGLYQTSTTGMPQINGIPLTATVTGPTTFTVAWNTNQSNYTALSGSPASAMVKKLLYPYLYFPGASVIGAITLGTTTTISTAAAHNFVVGQEVAFRVPSAWGTTQLNSLPNSNIPGSPIYGYVIAVTNYNTVVVNINSSAYTAFNSNPAVSAVNGLTFPQIVAVGDVNTGGVQISSGTVLYPPPYFVPISANVNTINGPAIQGAFVNNTSRGFIVGTSASRTDTSSWVGGSAGDVIEWRAYSFDISL